MLKSEIRLHFTTQRKALSANEIAAFSKDIAVRVSQLPVWHHQYFHLFLSIEKNKEVNTSPILELLKQQNKNIGIPKVMDDGILEHYLLEDSTQLSESRWGIPEPRDGKQLSPDIFDVVFVPLLAFDNQGHRVGYGKGFYDRFLRSCKPEVLKIGLSFFDPVDRISDINKWDIALDYCVTPSSTFEF